MTHEPSFRTSPTVKPLATSGSRSIDRRFEVRLTAMPLAALVGVVAGCMFVSFYLGLISGQRAGFESAQAMTTYNTVKMAVPDEFQLDLDNKELGSDAYAKLTDVVSSADLSGDQPSEMPKLESIKNIDEIENNELNEDGSEPGAALKELAKQQKSSILAPVESKPKLDPRLAVLGKGLEVETVGRKSNVATLGGKGTDSLSLTDKVGSKEVGENKKANKERNNQMNSDSSSATREPPRVLALAGSNVNKVTEVPKLSNQDRNQLSMVREVVPSGWYTQVAAPRSIRDAEELAERLKNNSLAVMIEMANVRGQEYYRVIVGPDPSRSSAQEHMSQVKSLKLVRGDPFVRLVK